MTESRRGPISDGQGFLDGFVRRLESEPSRPFLHVYADPETCRTITFGDLRELLANPQAVLTEQTEAGDLLFILGDDPLEQVVWWLAALRAGVIPGILTPLTPKLDPRKYFGDLRTLLAEYTHARVVLPSAGQREIPDLLPRDRLIAVEGVRAPVRARKPAADAALIFQQSSGTTGIRKGILLSEAAVVHQLRNYASAIELNERDVIVSWLPLYHDMGLVACLMLAVHAGVPLVLTSPLLWLQNPVWLFRAIERHKGTLCWLPNFAYNVLADRVHPGELANDTLASLRLATNCSERVVASSFEKFHDAFQRNGLRYEALASSYALAENTFAATQSPPGRRVVVERVDRLRLESERMAIPDPGGVVVTSSGKPLPNVDVRVVHDDAPLPDGEVGDIELQSDCLFDGYYGIGSKTKPFSADGWYRTGDYGYRRGDELFVLGRRNDVIIRAGRNLDPADIERALDDLPGIKPGRSVAFGRFNPSEGTEDVIVLAEFAAERVDDLDALTASVHQRLVSAVGLSPQRVEIVRPGWLVKSSSGKISRAGCLKKYEAWLERRETTASLFVTTYTEGIEEADKECFRNFGAHSKIRTPTMVTSPGRIQIGNWVSLGRHGKILMQTDFSFSKEMIRQHYPNVAHDFDPKIFGPRSPVLKIGDGTSIGDSFFISCANRIEIGRHVVFSDRVFISDSNHLYDNPELPIALQSNDLGKPIIIEDHSWIGINVVILEGVRIGRHSIISAASVVTQDVPPFSVVAGNPARVVRSIAPGGAQKPGTGTTEATEATEAAVATRGAASDAELLDAVAAYVSGELGRSLRPDDSLLRAGLLDSLATLRLLVFLEEKLGVRVDEQRFGSERPDSIADILRLKR